MRRLRIRLPLRPALLLALVPVLLLPLIGLRFVGQMAELTRDERRESLAGTARSFAGALHERSELFSDSAQPGLPGGASPIVSEQLAKVTVDGFATEWIDAVRHAVRVQPEAGVPASTLNVRMSVARTNDPAIVDTQSRLASAVRLPALYLLIEILDERFVPPAQNFAGDSIRLSVGANAENLQPIQVAPIVETNTGWQAELRLPAGTRFLRLKVQDVDYQATRKLEATADSGLLVVTGSIEQQESIAQLEAQRRARLWDSALAGFDRAGMRVAVYDPQGKLLAMRGNFQANAGPTDGILRTAARRLLAWAVKISANFDDPATAESPLSGALRGLPAEQSLRQARANGDPFWVISSAHPVWKNDRIAGALLLQQGSDRDLATGQAALEWLALMAALAISATVIGLLALASLTVARIVRLKDAAQQAIDARGRVVGSMPRFRLQDEVSELAQGYESVLARLREHQHYLANLRSRLVHELRTPIMVVRSSLENLQDARSNATGTGAANDQEFVERALGGATRLERIVASMSEAASLESMLADSSLEQIDLVPLLAGLSQSYNQAFNQALNQPSMNRNPAIQFQFETTLTSAPCMVVPETIAQAVDKLVANAADFAQGSVPIVISLSACDSGYEVTVQNQGPALPEVMAQSLFESMVSVRSGSASEQSHLGLGLYLVRLIAEFHGGQAFAGNIDGGVRIGFTIDAGENELV